MTQIENINFLSPLGFRLVINRLKEVEYFIQSINLPGMTLGTATQPTYFAAIPWAGDITYNDLTVTFKIDEAFASYISIYSWIRGLGFPHDFREYRTLIESNNHLNEMGDMKSDMTLVVLDNKHNGIFEVQFKDCFPINLSDLEFHSTDSTISYLTCTATFKYTIYEIVAI